MNDWIGNLINHWPTVACNIKATLAMYCFYIVDYFNIWDSVWLWNVIYYYCWVGVFWRGIKIATFCLHIIV
jgi:hypothetical protein